MGQTEHLDPELEKKLKHYRLSRDEHKRIVGLLGREPRGVEWALFSALWSEHCSYKSSKVHLKNLFSKGPRVLESFGENAGVVDLGHGERVAFKIESHNHPSFIEPYQGAATGVGGILRDVFTMGARPIALANYLCFGDPSAPRMRSIIDGVVRGIAGYGNSVGVPMLTGHTEFDPAYNNNVLVNAMAVGLFRPSEKVFLSKARGPGNLVVYAGSRTGRDGVHGASMASESFGADSAAKRPTVQIGDPFFEKLLIEACLEVMERDLVVAIQDMGAAGLTSSSFEMASKGGVGFKLHLDRVPLRDVTMTPEDILLSESQERMLMVVEPARLEDVRAIFARWGLEACAIGEVTATRAMELYFQGELLTQIDPDLLVEHAPQYQRPFLPYEPTARRSKSSNSFAAFDPKSVWNRALGAVQTLHGGSRIAVYEQFDQHVGANTVSACDEQVGVICLPDSKRALGVALGCRPQLMKMDAVLGGIDAVMRPALSLAVKGLEPLAVTDCLNFASPERVEVMSAFVASLKGMNLACSALATPIISGNVSLYNETQGKGVIPTPSTGLVGLGPSVIDLPRSSLSRAGSHLTVVSCSHAYTDLKSFSMHGDFEEMVRGWAQWSKGLTQFVRALQASGQLLSTRLVGSGGLLATLIKMSLNNQVGFSIEESSWTSSKESEFENAGDEVFYQVVLETIGSTDQIQAHWPTEFDKPNWWTIGRTTSESSNFCGLLQSVAELKRGYEGAWKAVQ